MLLALMLPAKGAIPGCRSAATHINGSYHFRHYLHHNSILPEREEMGMIPAEFISNGFLSVGLASDSLSSLLFPLLYIPCSKLSVLCSLTSFHLTSDL